MALLLPLDVAYGPGNVLATAGPDLQAAASIAILMMAIGVAAIVLKAERGRLGIDVAGVLLLSTYLLGLIAVYDLRPQ